MAARLSQPSFAVRLAVLLVASAAAVWCAMSLRDAKLQTKAIAMLVHQPPEPGRALALLDDADTLNASTTPELLRAGAYWAAGQQDRAIALIRAMVRAHPENISAWGLLARYLDGRDPAGAAQARQRARTLNGLKIQRQT